MTTACRAKYADLPGRLLAARTRADMTTTEAGAAVGKNEATIRNYETGRYLPPIPALYALAYAYGVSVYDLIDEND